MTRLKFLEGRIARLKRRAEQLKEVSNKYWTVRRVIFVCGLLLVLFFCKFSGTAAGCVLAASFSLGFWVVTVYHMKVRDSIARNSLMLDIKQLQVARIRLDWDQMPHGDQSPPLSGHPFESDLDITGERSLHRLLDTTVTKEGSHRLKAWLLNTAPDVLCIKERQSLVQELKGHSLFRDKLQLLSSIASGEGRIQVSQWDSNILVDWIQHRVRRGSLLSTIWLLVILAALNVTLITLAGFEMAPHVWPIAFVIYVGVMIAKQSQITTAWGELQGLEKALRRFRSVFQYLESRGYRNSPELAKICSPFLDKGRRPSAELKRLERLAMALGLRTNAILWLVVHAFIPWDFYFSHRLELLKKELADLLPRWLDAWYELEALNSIANFAYLNPGYVFPRVESSSPAGQPCPALSHSTMFAARDLGHPLIRPEAKVCND